MGAKFDELEGALMIDEHDLDNEVMAQSQRFNDAAQYSARAASRRDEAKDGLKTVEAELEIELRKKAEAAGEKTTDKAIAAKVQIHPRRKEAFQAYLDSSLQADKWEGLKESYKDRSFMIRELSGLWVTGYFQTTSTKGTQKQVDDAEYERRKKEMADRRRALNVSGRVRVKEQ
jgi:hypothetical protein